MSQDFTTNNGMITAAFAQQFHDSFEIQTQQKDSRLVQSVYSRGKITGYSFTVNDLGIVEMQDNTDRFGNTVWSAPEAGTRLVIMNDYDCYLPIEPRDLPKLLADPQGPYMQSLVSANNRKKDQIVFNALFDTVKRKTEKNGNYSDVVLPISQKIASAGNVITKAQIIKAKALFRKNECDEYNGEKLYIAYNSDMLEAILNDTALTNADFIKLDMLQDGAVATKWLGFTWLPYEALKIDGNVATTAAWCSSAVHFGTGIDFKTDVGVRRDKKNTIQYGCDASYGAGRTSEKKVVTISFGG